jgi:hypothetical protein
MLGGPLRMSHSASPGMEVGPAWPAPARHPPSPRPPAWKSGRLRRPEPSPLLACGPGGRQTGNTPPSSDGDPTASGIFRAAGCQNATTALFYTRTVTVSGFGSRPSVHRGTSARNRRYARRGAAPDLDHRRTDESIWVWLLCGVLDNRASPGQVSIVAWASPGISAGRGDIPGIAVDTEQSCKSDDHAVSSLNSRRAHTSHVSPPSRWPLGTVHEESRRRRTSRI